VTVTNWFRFSLVMESGAVPVVQLAISDSLQVPVAVVPSADMTVVSKVMSIMFSLVSGSRLLLICTSMVVPSTVTGVCAVVVVVSFAAICWYTCATVRPLARTLSRSTCRMMVESPAPRLLVAFWKPSVLFTMSTTFSDRAVKVSASVP